MKVCVIVVEEYSTTSPALRGTVPDTDKFEFQFVSHFIDAITLTLKQGLRPKIIFTDYICHHFNKEQKELFSALVAEARRTLPDVKIITLVPEKVTTDCPCVPEMNKECWDYAFPKPRRAEMIYEIIDGVL